MVFTRLGKVFTEESIEIIKKYRYPTGRINTNGLGTYLIQLMPAKATLITTILKLIKDPSKILELSFNYYWRDAVEVTTMFIDSYNPIELQKIINVNGVEDLLIEIHSILFCSTESNRLIERCKKITDRLKASGKKIPHIEIHNLARQFLNSNKEYENILNTILKQLSKDTGIILEGDIRYYIDQLERTGRTDVEYHGLDPDGSWSTPGGGIWGPTVYNKSGWGSFGEPGWGIDIGQQTEYPKDEPQREILNMSVYFGELIHAIGKRGPLTSDSKFSDVNVAKAMEHLGWAESVEKAALRPEYARQVNYFDGKPTYERVGGAIWHGIIKYKFGYKMVRPAAMLE